MYSDLQDLLVNWKMSSSSKNSVRRVTFSNRVGSPSVTANIEIVSRPINWESSSDSEGSGPIVCLSDSDSSLEDRSKYDSDGEKISWVVYRVAPEGPHK